MARGVVTVQTWMQEGEETGEFLDWYLANYAPAILTVPGVRAARTLGHRCSLGADPHDQAHALVLFEVEATDLEAVVVAIRERAASTPVSGMTDVSRTVAALYVEPDRSAPPPSDAELAPEEPR